MSYENNRTIECVFSIQGLRANWDCFHLSAFQRGLSVFTNVQSVGQGDWTVHMQCCVCISSVDVTTRNVYANR
jgi:hypothetical protein